MIIHMRYSVSAAHCTSLQLCVVGLCLLDDTVYDQPRKCVVRSPVHTARYYLLQRTYYVFQMYTQQVLCCASKLDTPSTPGAGSWDDV